MFSSLPFRHLPVRLPTTTLWYCLIVNFIYSRITRCYAESKTTHEVVDEGSSEAPSSNNSELKDLAHNYAILQKNFTELEDKYKRALAETENTRKRLTRQTDEARIFGIQSFCKNLLEVSDILSKAVDAAPKEELDATKNPSFYNLYQGLSLTRDQMNKVFERHGVTPIHPIEGDKFDPNVHEALFKTPLKKGSAVNTISTLTKVGYALHGRVLRPAIVGVFAP
ncbi:unnamed protein product [Protopolystoma xenopodis]|uniref:GrpE protein homolog n=1 Tax=Protopolystoma xenopodis TaxID=117903 RepID=A0A3S5A124_9PLAT|nr:unnamed protein product [Protopolystoma xenopodis]